ncbi:MAG: glycine dehydrogenase (aminomethyl-transferring) [Candidatus Dactylopiibacterium carminicum]|uniref:Glycine dehydrogenase (decarboxylating) n=1 Tax=Candidatus Dactylopiibacterium carminicum TaxID=857335 RepID=A0A272EUX7_9RHOO|nr:aminomethyl-transferring glycine dehydrogenase [Candidatus Dactylopiibacterium carminicum]KAF7599802.1 glycine dehydrogenase (aminomethyl-transferring) [Candidatus Dactylopiibacterium carminicum]PAS93913.1 MAG: glycine dehydrogenase (aminomethyl-transferring) [Candidatus Dactylopiibacterium carminicum]PAS97229.1 MAG: glycine dehydrogenase (aminomethyl-transferring) [Candidatus Dactylopiibacterium carminicum]PAS99804.1 MAG: glycine dehydrogenase (aminomethyl-transferring) [Candidatus Dactylop
MPQTTAPITLADLEQRNAFIARHLGPDAAAQRDMLAAMQLDSIDALIAQTVPAGIRLAAPLPINGPTPEEEALADLKRIASRNVLKKSLIGMGYYGTYTPTVILRNVMENPGWYTAYTPYQAEISQGRLEALLNWQQMIIDLTGLELANASLLDEATAAAEAMTMARRVSKSKSNVFFVDAACFPQTIDVVKTRAAWFGYELVIAPATQAADQDAFGVLLQYPDVTGTVADHGPLIAAARARGACVAVATDLMALVLLKSPGEMGADIAFGSAQRFGVPMGFGGPHAAFFATREANSRAMAGRIIGVSKDARGKTALRMALQTREQHIRREKANSNICTSQVLLANMAGFYAVWHGPEGLRAIARRIHRLAKLFAAGLSASGFTLRTDNFFDSFDIETGEETGTILQAALDAGYNLRHTGAATLGVSFDETHAREDLIALFAAFGVAADIDALDQAVAGTPLPEALLRTDAILTHPVFNSHHTEHQMVRYLKRLQNKDLALDHSMISLGSCTMKLNATSEMIPVTWPEFGAMHPFAPHDQAAGYLEMIEGLVDYLRAVTGFPAICMQPNSGAQGEYAGLVAIRRYQAARGEAHRNICLIPKSAHGTNPATAQMCGLEVVVVACDDNGNVDVIDLKAKLAQHGEHLAALMITYPSTHGVFEEAIREICELVHAAGGQVYMDGANLNAQVGLTSPATIGADVSHMNLHKTFCIPHGGGGPGMGPIGLAAHLAPFMADHMVSPTGGEARSNAGQGAVSAVPFGSASILPISWMYIRMMGGTGLKQATEVAILNANYVANQLSGDYPVLYVGSQGRVAHECILDIRPIKAATGITEVDIAKRLMDYGFHAPTMSFPVPGTIMIEPTESEDKGELDRFIAAMRAIRSEIRSIEAGEWPANDNPLKHAPHTQADVIGDEWNRPYSREQAVFPLAFVRENKFWPSVNRIDDVYGDRNLFCACVPVEEYEA